MERRSFVKALGAAALFSNAGLSNSAFAQQDTSTTDVDSTFTLNYAPHLGHFEHSAGSDIVKQIQFAAAQGFRGWEENFMASRPLEEQKRIGRALVQHGMQMGVFISGMQKDFWEKRPVLSSGDKDIENAFLSLIDKQSDTARYINARWTTVVPGFLDPKLPMGFQTSNMISLLNRACDIFEQKGIIMVLEPLNTRIDHPGVYLQTVSQAHALCSAINRPQCKILFDIYHEQIESGNLIPTIDNAWEHIAYFQVGDTPGRKEPTTGEINYKNVFSHIYQKGYEGLIGMEHGKSISGIEGERALINAYRAVDP
ncbi:hydroxypyruvate isomerase family protein [Ningiella sp. W23]|uniref:hydroxypyruvate isomerase family protein n=1 Tax=Ningiella sp. W23 TaxID=3023715 RepID=UPI0037583FB3